MSNKELSEKNWIWVTGASGYSGPFLIDELRKRYPESSIVAISRGSSATLAHASLSLDLVDANAIDAALLTHKPNVIFHLAAAMPPQSDIDLWYYNTAMIYELLTALNRKGLNAVKVVSIGSAAELEFKAEGGAFLEGDPSFGFTPYGKSKAAQSRIAKQLSKELGIDVYFPRAFNFIGPSLPDKWVAGRLCKQLVTESGKVALGNLQAQRDFVDIRDAVIAYCDILDKGKPGEVYNVCSGNPVAISELVMAAVNLMADAAPEIESDANLMSRSEVSIVYGDPSKINQAIGWQPAFTLEQTLTDMLESYRND